MEAHEANRIAYVIGNAAGGLIEAMGMQAENQDCLARGDSISYNDKAFHALMEERGLHHNALMGQLYGG